MFPCKGGNLFEISGSLVPTDNSATHLFTYSFIQAISMAPLHVHYYSEVLPTQHGYCVGVNANALSVGRALVTEWADM